MKTTPRRGFRRPALLVALALLVMLVVPLAGTALANHGDRNLDAEPETATRGVGATHTITARLCENDPTNLAEPGNCDDNAPADQSSGAIRIHFENEGGPNDPDNSTSRTTPDRTCNIFPVDNPENPDTPFECSFSYVGLESGTDTWRAWIDHDSNASTDNSDAAEGRNESMTPGATANNCGSLPGPAEPDCTDVVEVTWAEGGPATVDCDDENGPDTERETNPSGSGQSNETYSCEVRDAQGNFTGDADPNTNGVQQFRVHGEVENGVNDPQQDGATYATEDYGCNVGRAGQQNEIEGRCTITVTQAEGEEGTAEICFWVGTLDEGTGAATCGDEATGENQSSGGADSGNDLADQTEKTWRAGSAAQGGLDAEPETDQGVTGDQKSITATVYDEFGAPVNENNTVNFEFFQGSAFDTDGNSPATPDDSCDTNGGSACTITYSSPDPGRDLVCVWIQGHGTPVMVGNNQNGTCDGEGQTDGDDVAGTATPPAPANDDIDVVSKVWRNATPATDLDCSPETATTERDEDHTIDCTATDGTNGVSGTEVDIEAVGANDPDGSNSPTSPDFTCTTDNDGTCSVTHNPAAGSDTGETTYRAWIDEDYTDTTNESDGGEARDETATPGAAEPDNTDVVSNEWVADSERTISLDSNRNKQERGKRVRFTGSIDGDPNCEDGETVRLRRSVKSGGFKTMATTVTDNSGDFEFEIVVRKTRDYKAVAPATSAPDACDKARSPVVRVRVTD